MVLIRDTFVILATLVVAVLFGTLNTVQGELLWYESFDYPEGSQIAGNGPWQAGADSSIITPGLTYPGLSTLGGSGSFQGNSNKHVWVSKDSSGGTSGGPVNVDWNTPNSGVYYMTVLFDGGQNDVWHQPWTSIIRYRGLNAGIENTDSRNQTQPAVAGETTLIALRIDTEQIDRSAQGLGNPDNLQQFLVNPDLSAGEPDWDTAAIIPVPRTGDSFRWPSNDGDNNFMQFSRSPSGGDTYFDEIRIATTWAEAIGGGEAIPGSTAFIWNTSDSGDWQYKKNWQGNGSTPPDFPNSEFHSATFGSAITSTQTVFTNSAVTASLIRFENANASYVIAGSGGVNIPTGSMGTGVNVINGSHEFQTKVDFHSDGQLDIANDSTLTFNNALNLNGNTVTKTGGGTVVVNNRLNNGGGMIDVQEGVVSGDGTIGGNVDNGGTIAPGNSPGVLTINGNLNNNAGGTIAIEIEGTAGAGETQGHDQIQVTGSSTLDGTLSITTGAYADPTARAARDTFTLLASTGGSSGAFGTVNYNGTDLSADFNGENGSFRDHIDNGLFRHVNYDANNVSVTNLFALEGDADGDIDIDITDFNILASNFDDAGANSETNNWTTADFDADGDIDITDFNFLAANFSDSGYGEPATGQVPEPSTAILLLAGVIGLYVLAQRKT